MRDILCQRKSKEVYRICLKLLGFMKIFLENGGWKDFIEKNNFSTYIYKKLMQKGNVISNYSEVETALSLLGFKFC